MVKVKVDFTGVEEFVRCEEGEHIARIKKAEHETAESGNDMITVQFEVIKGQSTGATVYNRFVLTEKALWRLKQLMSVIGMKADGKVAIDLDKLIGKTLIIVVTHEEYNGSTQARLSDMKKIAAPKQDEDDDYEEEEDEPAPPKKAKKKPEPEPEEDEDEEEDEEPAPKKKPAPKKPEPPKKGKKKPEPDDDDDDDWDD